MYKSLNENKLKESYQIVLYVNITAWFIVNISRALGPGSSFAFVKSTNDRNKNYDNFVLLQDLTYLSRAPC